MGGSFSMCECSMLLPLVSGQKCSFSKCDFAMPLAPDELPADALSLVNKAE